MTCRNCGAATHVNCCARCGRRMDGAMGAAFQYCGRECEDAQISEDKLSASMELRTGYPHANVRHAVDCLCTRVTIGDTCARDWKPDAVQLTLSDVELMQRASVAMHAGPGALLSMLSRAEAERLAALLSLVSLGGAKLPK